PHRGRRAARPPLVHRREPDRRGPVALGGPARASPTDHRLRREGGAQGGQRVQGRGADFVKVYSRIDAESHRALLDEARRLDIPVAGHRSDRVPFTEQIESGQRSFEHVHGLWPATSRDAEALEAAMARIRTEPDTHYSSWFQQVNAVEWEAANTYGPVESASVFERLVANDVAY